MKFKELPATPGFAGTIAANKMARMLANKKAGARELGPKEPSRPSSKM